MRFTVTLTILPKHYVLDATQQYDLCTERVADLLNTYFKKYTLVAELTKSANIHYHVFAEPKLNVSEVHLNKLLKDAVRKHKYIGFICVKQATDEKGWIDYILKSNLETSRLISRPSILRDDLACATEILDPFIKVLTF